MSEPITLRWTEREFYSAISDLEILELQAVTSKGTWYAHIEANTRRTAEQRKLFKQAVLCRINAGEYPAYVDLDEEEELA